MPNSREKPSFLVPRKERLLEEVKKVEEREKVLEKKIEQIIEREVKEAEKENRRSRALFIIPPFPARTYPGRTAGPNYIASYLRETSKKGLHNINDWEYLDLDVVPPEKRQEELEGKLKEQPYAFVGISYLSFQADEAMEIAETTDKTLRDLGYRQRIGEAAKSYTPIICGNRGVADAEEYASLYPKVDYFVTGELFHQPLDTMVHVARAIKNQQVLDPEVKKKIPGIASYVPETGELIKTEPNPYPEAPIDEYFENIERKAHHPKYDFEIFMDTATGKPKETAQVYTDLGCNQFCRYCFESRRRPPKEEEIRSIGSFIKEIIGLVREGYRGIYFDDSTFTRNKPRVLRLMKIMGRLNRRYGVVWGFNTRIDCLDEEVIDTAIKNGCVYDFEGVESLVPEVIEGMGKLPTKGTIERRKEKGKLYYKPVLTGEEYVERANEVCQMMKEKGLSPAVFLIMGGPKLDRETGKIHASSIKDDKYSIRETVWKLQPTHLCMNVMRFIPDATVSRIPVYSEYRGDKEYKGGIYYKRWREKHQEKILTTGHPIYEAFESAGDRYPVPPCMTSKRCYKVLKYAVDQVNEFYRQTGKQIEIVTDPRFKDKYLEGKKKPPYKLATFKEMK